MAKLLGVIGAVLFHALVLTFGGIFFLDEEEDHASLAQVELLSADEVKKDEDKVDPETQTEELATEVEEPPDAAEILKSLDLQPSDAPALEAASLSAIELALSGQGGDGEFSDALSLASGGRIGGTGRPGDLDGSLEQAFTLGEIDQKPRAIVQSEPLYPAEMRSRKVEGLVTLIFVVDSSGKVASPRIEKSSHPAFESPALDAVRQWRFEPAVKGGQRVSCKMRIPIRFQPN